MSLTFGLRTIISTVSGLTTIEAKRTRLRVFPLPMTQLPTIEAFLVSWCGFTVALEVELESVLRDVLDTDEMTGNLESTASILPGSSARTRG